MFSIALELLGYVLLPSKNQGFVSKYRVPVAYLLPSPPQCCPGLHSSGSWWKWIASFSCCERPGGVCIITDIQRSSLVSVPSSAFLLPVEGSFLKILFSQSFGLGQICFPEHWILIRWIIRAFSPSCFLSLALVPLPVVLLPVSKGTEVFYCFAFILETLTPLLTPLSWLHRTYFKLPKLGFKILAQIAERLKSTSIWFLWAQAIWIWSFVFLATILPMSIMQLV